MVPSPVPEHLGGAKHRVLGHFGELCSEERTLASLLKVSHRSVLLGDDPPLAWQMSSRVCCFLLFTFVPASEKNSSVACHLEHAAFLLLMRHSLHSSHS